VAKPPAEVDGSSGESPASSSQEPDLALALRYEAVESMPRIVARGAGKLAQTIVAIAEQHKVPVRRDTAMVELLRSVDAGQALSAEARSIVSEVLCFLYHLDTLHEGDSASPLAKEDGNGRGA